MIAAIAAARVRAAHAMPTERRPYGEKSKTIWNDAFIAPEIVRTFRDESLNRRSLDVRDSADDDNAPLTTMHQPRAEIGRLAALELLRQINRDPNAGPPCRVRLDCELVIRESTQPLRLTINGAVRISREKKRLAPGRGARARKIAASI